MDNGVRHKVEFANGPFKNLFLAFIAYKVASGLKYEDSCQYTMRIINRQLNQMGIAEGRLEKGVVETLAAKRPNESLETQKKRISLLREFGKYLNRMGYDAYIMPNASKGQSIKSFAPYIFSDEEMRRIFQASDTLPPLCRYPHYHLVYPVLVRMLYSCGLRVTEALHIRYRDIDLTAGSLYIDNGKNWRSRVVPMSDSMTQVCAEYIERRFGGVIGEDQFIFQAPDGNCYSRGSVRCTVKTIYRNAGIPLLSNGQYPRVHDLRHGFCVRSMIKMQQAGMDLYCMLPLLSKFVGHKGLRETELYLRLPQMAFNEVALSIQDAMGGLFPEVCHESE